MIAIPIPEPRRRCATCGATRPLHELVCIVHLDAETDAWHCRDCMRDGKAGTGVGPFDAWLVSVLDANVAVRQTGGAA